MYQLHTVLLLILDTVLVQRTLTFTYLNSVEEKQKTKKSARNHRPKFAFHSDFHRDFLW